MGYYTAKRIIHLIVIMAFALPEKEDTGLYKKST
jgi:hypothetical protein